MSSVLGITANLQVKNRISTELQDVVKATKNSIKEFLNLDDATQTLVKEMKKIKQAAEGNERSFKREMNAMQKEIDDLRRKLGALDSVKARPKVSVNDQARKEIAAIKQEVKSLDGTKATVHVDAGGAEGGSFLAGGLAGSVATYAGDGLFDELIAASQANGRRAVMGGSAEELAQFQRIAEDLSLINPNVDKTEVKDLVTQATRFDNQNGAEYTRQALQLSSIRPDMGGVDEFQKTLFAMQQAWKEVRDTGRFGDTLAEIAMNTTDIRGEALDSIVEYSTQVTKFLDTPEKMASLMKEMNGLWSIDKGFDSIKEATIKLDNQGDLTNVLSTAYQAQGLNSEEATKKAANEALIISKAIHSDNQAENQFAVAALLQNFGTIKDAKVRQQLLNELGGGPGEDVAKAFAPLLEAAGRIGQASPSEFNYKGRLNQSFQTLKDNDPLRGFLEAKTVLSNELIGLGTVIAQEISPVFKALSVVVKGTKEALDEMPTWLALPVLGVAIGGVTYGLWKLKIALTAATEAAVRKRLGGDVPDIDIDSNDDKKTKNRGGNGRTGKRRWWNPLSKNTGEELLDEVPKKKNWLTTEETKRMALYGEKPKVDVPKVDVPKKGWLESLKNSIGGTAEEAKTLGKGLLKKLPYVGAAIGAGEILTSDHKLETAGRVGSEALGGWGGAAAGAAAGALVGSVVPVIGTAIGSAVGGIVGGIGGSWGAGALFEKATEWFMSQSTAPEQPERQQIFTEKPNFKPQEDEIAALRNEQKYIRENIIKPEHIATPKPLAPPAVSPAKKQEEKPKVVSLQVPKVEITLQADGVLQDIPSLLKMLDSPAIKQKINSSVEKAFIDAIETSGGPARVGGVPV